MHALLRSTGLLVAATLTTAGVVAAGATTALAAGAFSDTFDGNALSSQWNAYDGGPVGGSPYGTWDSSGVAVSGGTLRLTGDAGHAAGVAQIGGQLYGTWSVRFRATEGQEMRYVALLWPDSENWPTDGELDFAEEHDGDRNGTTGTVIKGPDKNQWPHAEVAGDYTQWHTATVVWAPGSVTYLMDGAQWLSTTTSVPTTPMHLCLQIQPGGGGGASATFEIDSVTVSPSTSTSPSTATSSGGSSPSTASPNGGSSSSSAPGLPTRPGSQGTNRTGTSPGTSTGTSTGTSPGTSTTGTPSSTDTSTSPDPWWFVLNGVLGRWRTTS